MVFNRCCLASWFRTGLSARHLLNEIMSNLDSASLTSKQRYRYLLLLGDFYPVFPQVCGHFANSHPLARFLSHKTYQPGMAKLSTKSFQTATWKNVLSAIFYILVHELSDVNIYLVSVWLTEEKVNPSPPQRKHDQLCSRRILTTDSCVLVRVLAKLMISYW